MPKSGNSSKNPRTLTITLEAGAATSALAYEADVPRPDAALVLAHGAGASQPSSFITMFARHLSASGLSVLTFDFLYMAKGRKIPDRAPVLESTYRSAIDVARRELPGAEGHLFIGGKSMGGRIASHLAADDHPPVLAGLVFLGY